MPDLVLENLTKSFAGRKVVDGLSMRIPAGTFAAFLGPNGAGKSTTVGMLTGLFQPDSGTVHFGALTPANRDFRVQLGVVFQSGVLDGRLTVRQNIRLRAAMYPGITADWLKHLMQLFSLSDLAERPYRQLSGGQRRRVDIVRALVNRPKLLVLDEPSTGLDIQTRTAIWDCLDQLRVELTMTVLLTTHYLEETETADDVFVIDHGCIIAHDTVARLKQQYGGYQMTILSSDSDAMKGFLEDRHQAFACTENTFKLAAASADTCLVLLQGMRPWVQEFSCQADDMNAIFLALTGKEIR